MKKISIALKPFHTGQVWELRDSNVQIGEVGKLLVHYRHNKGTHPKGKPLRVSASLSSKRELEIYLRENKALLVQE